MSTTTPNIGTLAKAASDAQAALAAAKDEQAADAAAVEAERAERSIEWAFRTITTYPQRQAEANERVTALLAAFDATVETDFGGTAKLYLAIARAMAAANAIGTEYAKARAILRQAGIIAPQHPGHREDPIGYLNAPYPPNSALPPFAELVASTLERVRVAAFRVAQPADDPGAFAGQVTDAEREAVIAYEWTLSQDLEALLGLRERFPDRFARNVSEADKVATAAYAAGRLARGYDAPFPKPYVDRPHEVEPPAFAADDVVRVRLYNNNHAPRIR